MQAVTRTAMTAEVTGWAAMGLFEPLELLDWTGGWAIVSLSSGDSLSRCDRRHTRLYTWCPSGQGSAMPSGHEKGNCYQVSRPSVATHYRRTSGLLRPLRCHSHLMRIPISLIMKNAAGGTRRTAAKTRLVSGEAWSR